MIKTIILDNHALYIENYKNIDYFDENTIRICCKEIIIVVNGENLLLDSFSTLSIKISGKIINVEYIQL